MTLRPLIGLLLLLPLPYVGAAEVTGELDWARHAVLGTPVSGTIAEVRATPGQRVTEGELLLRLDARRLRAELKGAEAEVLRLRLAMEESERELERARELYDRTVISRRDLDLAEIGQAMAQAEHARASAQRTRIAVDLEESRVRAPFDGLVSAVRVTPGEAVSNALQVTPLVEVVDDRGLQARAWLSGDELGAFAPGDAVEVEAGGERRVGQVIAAGLQRRGEGAQARYELLVRIPGAAGSALRAGLPAVIRSR
jgi:multidrug efflux system membrane fusion protein